MVTNFQAVSASDHRRLGVRAVGILLAAAGVYLLFALYLFLAQDRLLLPATPPIADLRTAPHNGETIDTWQPHGTFAGYVVTPAPSGQTRAVRGTFLLFHGNEESAESKLPLANQFVRRGYRVVIVEYPGHGRRSGPRTMASALQASRETLAAAVAKWPTPVYLVGESLGAGMAAQAVRHNEAAISGVVLITPWDSLADVAAEKYPMFPVRWMLHHRFDSVSAVAHYKGPLVLIGAEQDTLIPVRHARRFADEDPRARLILLPDANHDDWYEAMTPQIWQTVAQDLHAD